MSVQFDPISALTPVHLGAWWTEKRRRAYPIVEERAPLEPSQETFGSAVEPAFSFRLGNVPPMPAMWFFSEDRGELLQIQHNRFTRNWLRPDAAASEYPSYQALLPAFLEDFAGFSSFLEAEGFESPLLNQCELTYVNPIPLPADHRTPASVLTLWGHPTDNFLSDPEDGQVATRFVIPGPNGDPVGRLYVNFQTVRGPAGGAIYLLTLSAKGRQLGPGSDGVRAFLDIGHEWIVRGFTSVTTQPMHELWERTK